VQQMSYSVAMHAHYLMKQNPDSFNSILVWDAIVFICRLIPSCVAASEIMSHNMTAHQASLCLYVSVSYNAERMKPSLFRLFVHILNDRLSTHTLFDDMSLCPPFALSVHPIKKFADFFMNIKKK